ncbi:nucleotidyl transferase [Gaiella occulta]|uniref:Nucleotidyl transferase n=1 Tax=Gaiella occulta TaxID=1002870 RepID=A0A7M2YW39_9ACTN|nr:nucleotidyl transferase AbiEii/AbiGii toxin family protein [Gaiella occulta]RDI73638.1 nucleotidyl transferase [Gaiella occulta]
MSLHEQPEFLDYLVTIGERTGAGAAIIEKDYWVTTVLRVISARFREGIVFKGGTSLSKGWNLIDRFSEDIDLLIRTDTLPTRGGRDRYMKSIDAAVADAPGLRRLARAGRSERGISRAAVYSYAPQAPALAGLDATIVLEMGIRGGDHPTQTRTIDSLLAEHLRGAGVDDDDLQPFELELLDYRRTFLEKLFAIHAAVTRHLEGETGALNRQGRHYYDIYRLLERDEVREFIATDGYRALASEIEDVTRQYFPDDHRAPADLRFANSPALAPGDDLRVILDSEYTASRHLYYGDAPTLAEALSRIEAVRNDL